MVGVIANPKQSIGRIMKTFLTAVEQQTRTPRKALDAAVEYVL
jgi:hypothetical protein